MARGPRRTTGLPAFSFSTNKGGGVLTTHPVWGKMPFGMCSKSMMPIFMRNALFKVKAMSYGCLVRGKKGWNINLRLGELLKYYHREAAYVF